MVTNSPTEMLEAEHRVIAKVIGAVPALADQLDAGQVVDVDLPARTPSRKENPAREER